MAAWWRNTWRASIGQGGAAGAGSALAYSDAANAAIAASWEAAQCTGGGDQLFTDMLPWVFGSQFLASQQMPCCKPCARWPRRGSRCAG